MNSTASVPEFRWAQDALYLWITVVLPPQSALTNIAVRFEAQDVHFCSNADTAGTLQLDLHTLERIDPEHSSYVVSSRDVVITVRKEASAWWSRLLLDPLQYKTRCKIDWHRWQDPDAEAEKKPDWTQFMNNVEMWKHLQQRS